MVDFRSKIALKIENQSLRSQFLIAVLCGVMILCSAHKARAQVDLVLNGNFSATNWITPQPANVATTNGGQLGYNLNATGWTNVTGSSLGYNFLFTAGSVDSNGVNGNAGSLSLWSTNNGGVSTLTAPPGGGNFIAADGAYETEPIQQTITGLTPGQNYALSFYWGAAQQTGFSGATTELWSASLGGQTFSTTAYSLPSKGFSGWIQQTFNYTATNSSEVLSFLAAGTPSGQPPFSLLADVSMQVVVPEPSQVAMGLLLILFIGGAAAVRIVRQTLKV